MPLKVRLRAKKIYSLILVFLVYIGDGEEIGK